MSEKDKEDTTMDDMLASLPINHKLIKEKLEYINNKPKSKYERKLGEFDGLFYTSSKKKKLAKPAKIRENIIKFYGEPENLQNFAGNGWDDFYGDLLVLVSNGAASEEVKKFVDSQKVVDTYFNFPKD